MFMFCLYMFLRWAMGTNRGVVYVSLLYWQEFLKGFEYEVVTIATISGETLRKSPALDGLGSSKLLQGDWFKEKKHKWKSLWVFKQALLRCGRAESYHVGSWLRPRNLCKYRPETSKCGGCALASVHITLECVECALASVLVTLILRNIFQSRW